MTIETFVEDLTNITRQSIYRKTTKNKKIPLYMRNLSTEQLLEIRAVMFDGGDLICIPLDIAVHMEKSKEFEKRMLRVDNPESILSVAETLLKFIDCAKRGDVFAIDSSTSNITWGEITNLSDYHKVCSLCYYHDHHTPMLVLNRSGNRSAKADIMESEKEKLTSAITQSMVNLRLHDFDEPAVQKIFEDVINSVKKKL